MEQMERIVVHLPGRSDRLEITVGLLTLHRNQDHYAYERGDTWHVGLGAHASLRVDPMATTAIIDRQGKKEIRPVNGDLTDLTREFTVEYSKSDGSVFGQVGFNYGRSELLEAYPSLYSDLATYERVVLIGTSGVKALKFVDKSIHQESGQ